MRLNTTAIVARNVDWTDGVSTEPYEAGWASEAVVFVRALRDGVGAPGRAHIEISPDGMHWVREGTSFDLPIRMNAVAFARVASFGNWLRIACEFPDGSSVRVIVTLHLKD